MITQKIVYQANDGTSFDTRKKTIAYIEDKIQTGLNEILKGAIPSYRDLITIIITLAGDIDKAKRVKRLFDQWLSGEEEDAE